MNNECDPQVGWKDYHTWHARPYYAAWVVKSLALHLEMMADAIGVDYAILSNDNGFIGEWGNRTLLARFGPAQWIEDGQRGHLMLKGYEQREMSTPPFAMLKKPVFNAMTLLSYLGEERLAVKQSARWLTRLKMPSWARWPRAPPMAAWR
jgi:L-iduronidase